MIRPPIHRRHLIHCAFRAHPHFPLSPLWIYLEERFGWDPEREGEAHQNPPAFHKEEGGGPGVAEKGREGRRGQQNLGRKSLRTKHHQEMQWVPFSKKVTVLLVSPSCLGFLSLSSTTRENSRGSEPFKWNLVIFQCERCSLVRAGRTSVRTPQPPWQRWWWVRGGQLWSPWWSSAPAGGGMLETPCTLGVYDVDHHSLGKLCHFHLSYVFPFPQGPQCWLYHEALLLFPFSRKGNVSAFHKKNTLSNDNPSFGDELKRGHQVVRQLPSYWWQ